MKTRLLLAVLLAGSTVLTGCGSLTGFPMRRPTFRVRARMGSRHAERSLRFLNRLLPYPDFRLSKHPLNLNLPFPPGVPQ